MPLARRRAARARRSPARRRLRRLTFLTVVGAAVGTIRNKKIEENRRRFDLP